MRTLILALLLSLLAACAVEPSASKTDFAQSSTPAIVRVVDMELATGEHLYILEYRTTHSIHDLATVAREAESFWPTLRPKSEAAGHSSAGIRAIGQPTDGSAQTVQAYTFIWQRSPAGNWQQVQDGG